MKSTIALVAGLATLFLAVPSASAKGKGKGGRARKDLATRVLAKYDTNKDGALSKEELATVKPKLAKKLAKADADKDGALSASELSTLKGKAHKHGKKQHKKG